MSKEFKPTHTLHYREGSPLYRMFPKGIEVVSGYTDEDGMIEWLSDAEGNVGGYTLPLYVGSLNRGLFNYVEPL